MAALHGDAIVDVSLEEATGEVKTVPPSGTRSRAPSPVQVMPAVGVEPTRPEVDTGFESRAPASSATPADAAVDRYR